MSKLVCLSGMNKGDQFPLHEGRNLLGRSSDCNIILFDKKCSHHHCIIYKRENHFSIEDLESSNGSRLNGKVLKAKRAVPCSFGDLIQLGRTSLKLSERAVGGAVDQEATDIAAELQSDYYDKLLRNTSMDLANLQNRKLGRKGIAELFHYLFPGRR